ncbi:hypothetical protein [Paraburkholderia sp. BL6669N2]|uniref:hypothetical protein n=1 Tax=Paraburkholderia sp. BL6669N2 TaxID=1938807 RepID=UPI0011C02F38|nr:hypothetical protein [Paraburkholderia sp. BL6669N2]
MSRDVLVKVAVMLNETGAGIKTLNMGRHSSAAEYPKVDAPRISGIAARCIDMSIARRRTLLLSVQTHSISNANAMP